MADDPLAAVLARIEELTVKRHALRADWLDIDAGELADVTEELLGWGDRSRAALEAALAEHQPEPGMFPPTCSACRTDPDGWGRDEWPCKTYRAVSRELLSEEGSGDAQD